MTLLRTVLSALIVPCVSLSAQDAAMNRTVLPIPEPKYPHITEVNARKAKAPPRFEVARVTIELKQAKVLDQAETDQLEQNKGLEQGNA